MREFGIGKLSWSDQPLEVERQIQRNRALVLTIVFAAEKLRALTVHDQEMQLVRSVGAMLLHGQESLVEAVRYKMVVLLSPFFDPLFD